VSVFESGTVRRRISSWEGRHRVFYGLRDPVVKRSLLVLVLVAGVVLFLVLRGPGRPAFTFGPSIKQVPGVGSGAVIGGVPSWWGGSPPSVAREAWRIAASNPTVSQLVRLGDGERFGNVGGSRTRGSGTAWLGYKLKRPVAVNADLPYIVVPPDGPARGTCVSPYAAGWAHLRATGVTALWVIVDLRRDQVVQISTNARQGRISPVAGKPYPTCNENQTG
jgi:hypothetical protein